MRTRACARETETYFDKLLNIPSETDILLPEIREATIYASVNKAPGGIPNELINVQKRLTSQPL